MSFDNGICGECVSDRYLRDQIRSSAVVEATRHPDALSAAWRKMEHQLRQDADLTNPAVTAVLADVFGPLLHYRTQAGTPVVVEARLGREWNTFFRSRVFQTMEALHGHPSTAIVGSECTGGDQSSAWGPD
jgi:hypothetical protein